MLPVPLSTNCHAVTNFLRLPPSAAQGLLPKIPLFFSFFSFFFSPCRCVLALCSLFLIANSLLLSLHVPKTVLSQQACSPVLRCVRKVKIMYSVFRGPDSSPRRHPLGIADTEIKVPSVRTQCSQINVHPLKPRVGQNIATYATPAAVISSFS